MTRPKEATILAFKKTATQWANRDTPFIFDEWYIAGFPHEFRQELTKRTFLGRPLVLFRSSGGSITALDDRCVHRSFPLSLGTLEGDTLVCGYHGMRYDQNGDVIEVPSQPRCPSGVGVRSYKLVEKGPLVWIWMGEKDEADETKIPFREWMDSPKWVTKQGYMHMQASYVSLHENLLDLTHLSYLHSKTFGTPDYARASYEVTIEDGYYALQRNVVPTKLPPLWAKSTGLTDEGAARIATSEFLSPGAHETTAMFYDTRLPEAERTEYTAKSLHLPTPETNRTTHYFVLDGRSFALDEKWITDFMHEQLLAAFHEDVAGLEAVERIYEQQGDEVFEMSVASDRASIEMRKYLKRRAEALHRPTASVPGDVDTSKEEMAGSL